MKNTSLCFLLSGFILLISCKGNVQVKTVYHDNGGSGVVFYQGGPSSLELSQNGSVLGTYVDSIGTANLGSLSYGSYSIKATVPVWCYTSWNNSHFFSGNSSKTVEFSVDKPSSIIDIEM